MFAPAVDAAATCGCKRSSSTVYAPYPPFARKRWAPPRAFPRGVGMWNRRVGGSPQGGRWTTRVRTRHLRQCRREGPVSNWVPRKQRRHRPVSGKLTGGGAGEAFLRVRRGGLSTSCRRQRSGCGTLQPESRSDQPPHRLPHNQLPSLSPRERPREKHGEKVPHRTAESNEGFGFLGLCVAEQGSRLRGNLQMRLASIESSSGWGRAQREHTPSSMPPRAATLPAYH
jgi:hypothetical protein